MEKRFVSKNVTFTKLQMSGKSLDSRDLKFGLLRSLLRLHRQCISNQNILQWSCLREISENIWLLVTGLNKKLQRNLKIPSSPHDLMESLSCYSNDKSCMHGDCDSCLSTKLDVSNIVNISRINPTSSDDISGGSDIDALLMHQIFGQYKSEF